MDCVRDNGRYNFIAQDIFTQETLVFYIILVGSEVLDFFTPLSDRWCEKGISQE